MYEFIFQSKLATAASGGTLLLLACALMSGVGYWWRVLALNYSPVLAAGFMLAIVFSDQRFSSVDVLAALAFEFAVLCVFCRFAIAAYRSLHAVPGRTATRMLALGTLLYSCSLVPALLSGGFGIFSAGTRIDYLYENSGAKYFTYAGLMISVVLGGLLARRLTLNHKLGIIDYLVILVISGASIVAGSKGGFILWLGAVLAFVDYREARIKAPTIALALIALTVLVTILALVVSDFLRLTIPEFFELTFNRFFVNNDARALAFDLRPLQVDPGVSPLSEAFRSFSSGFGYPPQNAPLGAELYDRYFGPSGGAGGNASLVAIAIYYTSPDYAVLPLALASLSVFAILFIVQRSVTHIRSGFSRYAIQIVATFDIAQFSQDFLAFQVVLPMTALLALLLYGFESIHVIIPRQPRSVVR